MQPPVPPNWITALRLPLAPIAVVFLINGGPWGIGTAAVLALCLEITDIADGQIARRYGVVSNFGKLFDPFSDAFCRFTLFLGLFAVDAASLWMILIIFYRDASISFFRSVSASRNIVLAARKSGKIKAIVQGVGTQIAFLSLAVGEWHPEFTVAAWWTMLVITIVTALSFVDYYLANRHMLRDAWHDRPVED